VRLNGGSSGDAVGRPYRRPAPWQGVCRAEDPRPPAGRPSARRTSPISCGSARSARVCAHASRTRTCSGYSESDSQMVSARKRRFCRHGPVRTSVSGIVRPRVGCRRWRSSP
jgi:hypothetical protein